MKEILGNLEVTKIAPKRRTIHGIRIRSEISEDEVLEELMRRWHDDVGDLKRFRRSKADLLKLFEEERKGNPDFS
ncbi:MAG: hypothetical protein EOP84_28190 [Verrucomicrobiaceae bacterium]|nr:MAG: hypothetical protein EOP84_28190 [Verrucomicrobiaceae bacterium]